MMFYRLYYENCVKETTLMSNYFMPDSPIRFVFPINGDCVNERDGRPAENGVSVSAFHR